MNNMLKRSLLAALAISTSFLSLSAHTNKNFLSSPRPQRANLLLDSYITRDLVGVEDPDRFGGNLIVNGYHSESTNPDALGRYFGVNGKSSFRASWGNAANNAVGDLNAGFLVHDSNAATGGAAGVPTHFATVNLRPKTVTQGVEFGYVQALDKMLDGLRLAITLPIERVENSVNLSVTDSGASPLDTVRLTEYLNGTLNVPAGAAAGNVGPIAAGANEGSQAPLRNGLIGDKQTASGIADVHALLAYDVLKNDDWTLGINVGLSIPTGNTPSGRYLFEPIYGNAGHWELGFGGTFDGRLWEEGAHRLGLHLGADYRYGFESNETRIISGKENWSRYYLTGLAGGATIDGQQFQPAANLGTVPVSVTPNSSLRGNVGLDYGNGGFLFGVHYAPAWRQAETVAFRGAFVDNAAAVVAPEQDPNAGAALVAGAAFAAGANTGVGVTRSSLLMESASRPIQLSHRLGAELGYTFSEYDTPVSFGVGGHYELASHNSSAENWGVSVKAGIGF